MTNDAGISFCFFFFLPETLRRGDRELSELISSMFVELVEVEVKERRKKKNEPIGVNIKVKKNRKIRRHISNRRREEEEEIRREQKCMHTF